MKYIKKLLILAILVVPFFIGMKEVKAGWRFYQIYNSICVKDGEQISARNENRCKAKGGQWIKAVQSDDECIGENQYLFDDPGAPGDENLCFYGAKTSDEPLETCVIDDDEYQSESSLNNGYCQKYYWQIGDSSTCKPCSNYSSDQSEIQRQEQLLIDSIEKQVLDTSYYSYSENSTKACYIGTSSAREKVCTTSFYYTDSFVVTSESQGSLRGEACTKPIAIAESYLIKIFESDRYDQTYGGFLDTYGGGPKSGQTICKDGWIRKGAYCYECSWIDVEGERIGKFDCGILSDYFNKLWTIILIVAPVMAILFSAFDIFKAVTAGDEKAMKSQVNRIVKRLIIMVVVILLPLVVNMVIGFTNYNKLDACMDIGSNSYEEEKTYVSYCQKGKFLGYEPYVNKMVCFNSLEDKENIQDYYDEDQTNRPNISYVEASYTEE